MKIAIPVEQDIIFQHFGHASAFRIYEVSEHSVTGSSLLEAEGHGHDAMAALLAENGVDLVICGGIGTGAETALTEAGIAIAGGVAGSADDAVAKLLDGTLEFTPSANCDHHSAEAAEDDEDGCGCGGGCGGCGGCGGGCGGCGEEEWVDDYYETRTFTDIVHLTYENFEAEVLQDPGLICIDFWAEWCQPCKMMAPIFEEVNAEQPKVKFCKVNCDAQPEIAQLFGIQNIPTVVLVKARRTLDGFIGVQDKQALTELVEAYVK